jgi:hypothetical protein
MAMEGHDLLTNTSLFCFAIGFGLILTLSARCELTQKGGYSIILEGFKRIPRLFIRSERRMEIGKISIWKKRL